MIHVCFGLHDATGRYSKFTGTAMLSLLENTKSDVTVHILHDNTLSDDNRAKLSDVAARFRQAVKFYNVETLCADKLAEYLALVPDIKTARVGVGAFFRFMIPKIFLPEIVKVIYLDADVIINLDIAELWAFDLGDKPLGVIPNIDNGSLKAHKFSLAVRDGFVNYDDYFNSGVLLMNLEVWDAEENIILDGLRYRGTYPPDYELFDQEILNYCFAARALKLPAKFNRMVKNMRADGELVGGEKIYHYAGGKMGLGLDTDDAFNRLWWRHFIKTPWFDEEVIGRIFRGCLQSYARLHDSINATLINLSATMSGKTRAFYVTQDNLDMVKESFAVRDDEEIILASSSAPLKKLVEKIRADDGSKIFFVIVPQFPFRLLTRKGFTAGKDFVNGAKLLPGAQDLSQDFYELIPAM